MTRSDELIHEVDRLLCHDGPDDPYPLFARLRAEAPMLELGDFVVVSRYDAVRAVYTDSEHFLSNSYRPGTVELRQLMARIGPLDAEQRRLADEVAQFSERLLAASIPPDHARRREVFRHAFNPRMVADLEGEIQQIVDRLLGTLVDQPEVELVSQLGYRVPRFTHMCLLGLPDEDYGLINGWAGKAASYLSRGEIAALRPYHEMITEFRSYVDDVVKTQRRLPRHRPFLAALIAAVDQGTIDVDELAAMYATVLLTGTDTAMSLITTGMVTLLRNHGEWTRLCEAPKLAALAVEECLRFETPVQGTGRNVASGATLDGKPIQAGRRVLAMIASANRDPSIFADADTFLIGRPDGRFKLSFATGPHECLGSALARLEGRVVFSTLARRHPHAELIDESLEWRRSPMIRAPKTVRVALGDPC